jgi:hypothetical protein
MGEATPIPLSEAAHMVFAVGDYNREGHADVFCLKTTNTGSGKLEVNVLNGAERFRSFLMGEATPMPASEAANFWFGVPVSTVRPAQLGRTPALPGFAVNAKTEFRTGQLPFIGADAAGFWSVIDFSLDHEWAAKAADGVDIVKEAGYDLPAVLAVLVPIELSIYADEIRKKNSDNGVYIKIQLPQMAVAGYHNVTITPR